MRLPFWLWKWSRHFWAYLAIRLGKSQEGLFALETEKIPGNNSSLCQLPGPENEGYQVGPPVKMAFELKPEWGEGNYLWENLDWGKVGPDRGEHWVQRFWIKNERQSNGAWSRLQVKKQFHVVQVGRSQMDHKGTFRPHTQKSLKSKNLRKKRKLMEANISC